MDDIMVSICCLAYNHEKYIRKALEGFVNQKTNFKYEILIHDDASTDGTADIIREYQAKYPEIIKPIYQTENQHSKKVRVSFTYQYPRAKGKYVAWCEGDDYWCSDTKLQEQVDVMERNPDVVFCVHKVSCVNEIGEPLEGTYPSQKIGITEGVIKSNEFIEMLMNRETSYPFQTSSYFVRNEILQMMIKEKPSFAIRDMGYMWYFASCGSTYYIDKEMSCYRRNVPGSWSVRNKKLSHEESNKIINAYVEFNKYTNGKYAKLMKDSVNAHIIGKICRCRRIHSFKELFVFSAFVSKKLFQRIMRKV